MVQSIKDSSLKSNISNQINWRKNEISILYIKFPEFFFTGKEYMKTPKKVIINVHRIIGTLFRMSITFKCIFSREDHLWLFLAEG